MRKILAAVFTMAICSVKAQAPILEAFNLGWKIIPARLNINTHETDAFTTLNYRDSRVEISSTEQAFMVNIQKNENAVILLTDELKVKWQTPIQGKLFALYKVNDKLVVIHNGSPELRNENYALVLATILDPSTGKKIATKDLLGSRPDYHLEVHTFADPGKKGIILGFRHTPRLLIQKPKSLAELHDEDYNLTTKYEIAYFDGQLERQKTILVPLRKSAEFYQIEMTLNKNFIICYKETPGTIGLQAITGEKELWYKTYSLAHKKRSNGIYKIVPSTLFPDIFFFTTYYQNQDKDPALSLFRINSVNEEVKRFDRVITKEYKKELKKEWLSVDANRKSQPVPFYWEYFRFSSITELQNRVVVVAEAIYDRPTRGGPGNTPGSMNTSTPEYENSDMLLSIFDNDLKNLDEKLIGKIYTYTSNTANFAGVFLSDHSFYIITALDKNTRVTRPIVMKYDLQNQSFEFQKIADEGTRLARRRISPPSTLWFKKGFVLVFWDDDDTFTSTVRKTDLQLFPY